MKLPSHWTPVTIKQAFDEGTAERTFNGRTVRVVTNPALKLLLTSAPKTKLHQGIHIGPWRANGELEARLAV
jgi:hypothetical protein